MARILIIDDDQTMRGMLRDLLSQAQHEVHEATNGREALIMLRQLPADLVIIDMLMPEMEGVETICSVQSGFPDVKIIAMSDSGVMAAAHHLTIASKLGVRKTLQKPFLPPEMLAAVNDLLNPPHLDAPNSKNE